MGSGGVSRRKFLQIGAAGGGGLLVAFYLPGLLEPASGAAASAEWFNAYLTVHTDGRITVRVPVPEMGQGIRTALAMLVAEELDADWRAVTLEQSDTSDDMGPRPFAGGSFSVREHWIPMREAGAAARAALVATAGSRWNAPVGGLESADGYVRDPRSGRRLGYGELAAEAARLPSPSDVRLKDPSEFTLIGRSTPHLDTPAIVRGEIRFGIDTIPEGALRAVVARCPTYGGTVASFDPSAALAVPGVVQVVKVDRVGGEVERPYAAEGVAVVATSTWAALEGRRALVVDWDRGVNTAESTERLHDLCRELLESRGDTFREDGDVDSALAGSPRTVEAVYHAPFLAHMPMEPMNCVAEVSESSCRLWAATQMPLPLQRNAASLLDLETDQVHVHVTRIGGAFGRRLSLDFALEAIQIARQVDGPVQLLWTREDDVRHGFFRPFSYHLLRAGLDSEGRLTGWLHRQAGTSRYAFRDGPPFGLSEFRAGTYPAALAPAHRLEYALAESNISRGPLRAPGLNAFTFAVECFLDELAHEVGRDPLELRLSLLGEPRLMPYDEDDEFDTGRMAGVLRTAAEGAGWGRPLLEGRGLGIGCTFTFGSYAAQVVEASVDEGTGRIRVHRVTGAIDCGQVVNPNGVRAQMEGGVMDALGAALHGEITVAEGVVEQSNFGDYPVLRFSEAPEVNVHIVASEAPPTGAGEPPYPPVFPALANAVFAAAGVRLRRMPFRPDRVRSAFRTGRPEVQKG